MRVAHGALLSFVPNGMNIAELVSVPGRVLLLLLPDTYTDVPCQEER